MTQQRNGPPQSGVPAPPGTGNHDRHVDNTENTSCGPGPDLLADLRRRREAAIRLDGSENPDPVFPGRQFHPASTGLRALGYREGYAAAIRYVLREFGEHLSELSRAKLTAIANRSGE